jgi:hypothetical protein
MAEKRRATVKVMENVTDQELEALVKGLKKIQGFDFSIDSFVIIKSDQAVDALYSTVVVEAQVKYRSVLRNRNGV